MGGRQKKSKKPSGTRAEQLLEESIFYIDECLGRHVVAPALRAAGWRIEAWHSHFPPGTEDVVWLPFVGEQRWVALTKDKAIRRVPSEMEKVIAAQVRLFTLPIGNMTGEEMARIFLGNRLKMGRLLHRCRAPFVAMVSRSGVDVLREGPSN